MSGWFLKTLGNCKGGAQFADMCVRVERGEAKLVDLDSAELWADGGKLGDSEDSFVYLYCKIDPGHENFFVQAQMRLLSDLADFDGQSGFGVMLADTDASEDKWCRYRNQLLVGCFGREHKLGVRLVAGYSDERAREFDPVRIIDQRRTFTSMKDVLKGDVAEFSIAKTDEGFTVTCDGESIDIAGCSFLTTQAPDDLCVGFAVARNARISLDAVVFASSPGLPSETPEGTIVHTPPSYPFPESLLNFPLFPSSLSDRTVYVSPYGRAENDGSYARPLSMEAALMMAGPGTRIIAKAGVYKPQLPLIVPRGQKGTPFSRIRLEAEEARQVVFDGSALKRGMPLFVLAADFWEIAGIVFCNSPLSGLTVCGSHNLVDRCEALGNADTGILIIAPADADRLLWPQDNYVRDCDSHDNCDATMNNADGFGAKLRVGRGNSFYRCIAHHNIDDGFDLYAKSLYGPTAKVELDSCIAYANGAVADSIGVARNDGGGIGFKLGGENQAVAHEVWNCLAYDNRSCGFNSNSNPACQLHFCTAAGNGVEGVRNFKFISAREPQWVKESLLEFGGKNDARPATYMVPLRCDDGSIDLGGQFPAIRKRGGRLGADFSCKKILMLICSLGGGGAERVACKLATEFSKRHRVWLMYNVKKDITYPLGDKVHVIDASPRQYGTLGKLMPSLVMHVLRGTRRILSVPLTRLRFGIDVTVSLLSPTNKTNVRIGGKRKIISERNDPSRKPSTYLESAHYSAKRADYVVFQSEKVKNMFVEEVGERCCIIPNPVEPTCHAAAVRAKKIVTSGRLHPQKNQALLIRAFAGFLKTHPDYHLHLYGEGELLDDLVQLADELNIAEHVHFAGFCIDIHEAISDAEMFVLSSDYEGLSNALIEAMLMGIACISTACTGSDELVHDGEDGLLVPVGDEHALYEAMCRLSDDAALRVTLEYNGSARFREFSPDNIARKWERIL